MSETEKKSGFGTAALVLGIIGICTSFIPIVNNLSFILGIIGLILGIVSLIKKASKGVAIAGVILCILAMVITVNAQKSLTDAINDSFNELDNSISTATGDNTEEVLKNGCDVEIGEFKVSSSYGIEDTKLPVTVTNKTSERKSFSIQIEAVNDKGDRITSDYVYANDLNAGQSQEVDIFTLVTSDEIDDLKDATFKIVEASMY